jgi:DNA-binding LacI/PurR family transcriptional regulator
MARIKTATITEQIATHLREAIQTGHWVDKMPGRDALAADLGVSPRSTQKALKILEREGLLVPQGQGRNYKIQLPEEGLEVRPMRVAMLVFKQADKNDAFIIELRHQLDDAGHITIFPYEGSQDLGMDVKRVERLVLKTRADVWLVFSASRRILQWFVDHNIKVFALAGRRFNVPIAGTGPNKVPLYNEVTQKLISLGHQRIVMVCSKILRYPAPSKTAREFVDTMETNGIRTGSYNLPDWEETAEGFNELLDSLFRATPPTAMIFDEAFQYYAACHYFMHCNLRVPQDVSLVCSDADPGFNWCRPSVAHFFWDYQPIVRRIMRWMENISRGVDDRRKSFTKAVFVNGGTIGPPPD